MADFSIVKELLTNIYAWELRLDMRDGGKESILNMLPLKYGHHGMMNQPVDCQNFAVVNREAATVKKRHFATEQISPACGQAFG